jgi:hypothetical protein
LPHGASSRENNESLEILVYGVVINFYGPPTHARSLLLAAENIDGLKLFISGLKAYLRSFPSDLTAQWHQGYLSNVVSVHDPFPLEEDPRVYKAYDYCLRTTVPHGDRRQHNINLVRGFIDPEAELTSG